jgi:hypothetical protein
MKKGFKFGKFELKQDTVIKIVTVIVTALVVMYMINIFKGPISDLLGQITNATGSLSNAISSCVDCDNRIDSKGKKIDPKQACPRSGIPFFNLDCMGFIGFFACILLIVLLTPLAVAGVKGRLTRTNISEAASVQGNLSDSVQVQTSREAEQTFKEDFGNDPDGICNSFRETLELGQFKEEWNGSHTDPKIKIPDSINTSEDLDIWLKNNLDPVELLEAETLSANIQSTVSNIKNESVYDLLLQIKLRNNLANKVYQDAPPDKKAAMKQTVLDESARQGEALARERNLNEDVGKDVCTRTSEDNFTPEKPWEYAVV